MLVIVFGVALASAGEIQFRWIGFWCQMSAIGFEAIRLVMTQVLLSGDGQKMDPLVSLYYYAPVCAIMNFILVWFTEMATFKMEDFVRVGPAILVINASVAFLLNLASLFLVGIYSPEAVGPFANLSPDRKDEQLGADSDRHFQIHPPCRGRGTSLGFINRLAPAIRLQFGTRGPFLLLCAARNHKGVCGPDEERASNYFTIDAIGLWYSPLYRRFLAVLQSVDAKHLQIWCPAALHKWG